MGFAGRSTVQFAKFLINCGKNTMEVALHQREYMHAERELVVEAKSFFERALAIMDESYGEYEEPKLDVLKQLVPVYLELRELLLASKVHIRLLRAYRKMDRI